MAYGEDSDAGPGKPAGIIRRVLPADGRLGSSGNESKKRSDDPSATSCAYDAMAERWALPLDLFGGTQAMRDAATRWLPQEPAETDEAYAVRLRRSFLFNGYRDTVRRLVSYPFSRPVSVDEAAPESVAALAGDVDLQGTDLTQFARAMLLDAAMLGLTHVLVDYPTADPSGVPRSVADEARAGLRPFFVHVCPTNVIGWRSEKIGGVETLTHLRIKESIVKRDGEFGDAIAQCIRVFDVVPINEMRGEIEIFTGHLVSWALWRLAPKSNRSDAHGGWYVAEAGMLEGVDRIPLVTFYANTDGFMHGSPPLEDLAWVNLAHYQSGSDQRNILRFARTGILFGAGFSEQDLGANKRLEIGANRMLMSENPQAQLRWVEHSGASIGAGRQDLVDLKEEMATLGLQPLVNKTGGMTATQAAIDTAHAMCDLRAWARSLENALSQAFGIAAKWMAVEIAAPIVVDVDDDWGLSVGDAEDVRQLIDLRRSRDLSRETLWSELRRRGLLDDSFDGDEEEVRLQAEEPPLGSFGSNLPGQVDGAGEGGDQNGMPDHRSASGQ